MPRKRNKSRFNNKPTGKFKSEFEQKLHLQMRYADLDPLYEDEGHFIPYVKKTYYKPDFTLEGNGKTIYIEAKGYFPKEQRSKMIQIKKQNPDRDIRIVFQADNYLTKNKKMTYSDWARRFNFPFAIKKIPKEWLDEVKEDV